MLVSAELTSESAFRHFYLTILVFSSNLYFLQYKQSHSWCSTGFWILTTSAHSVYLLWEKVFGKSEVVVVVV